MKVIRVMVLILVAALSLVGCQSYAKSIKSQLKINHVYAQPSSAYGPGTIVMYLPESGYTRTCWAWDTSGIAKADYPSILIENPIQDITIKEGATIELGISIDKESLLKIDPKFKSVSSVRITLTKGRQFDYGPSISEAYARFRDKDNVCYKEIAQRYESSQGRGRFYFILVAYAYDFRYEVKVNDSWSLASELPKELLSLVNAKIDLNYEKDTDVEASGKNLFIGFNGDPVVFSSSKAHDKSLAPVIVYDITDEVRKMITGK